MAKPPRGSGRSGKRTRHQAVTVSIRKGWWTVAEDISVEWQGRNQIWAGGV